MSLPGNAPLRTRPGSYDSTDRLKPASIRPVHRVSEEDVMITALSIVAAFVVWFGVMAETAPTVDYMSDDH